MCILCMGKMTKFRIFIFCCIDASDSSSVALCLLIPSLEVSFWMDHLSNGTNHMPR